MVLKMVQRLSCKEDARTLLESRDGEWRRGWPFGIYLRCGRSLELLSLNKWAERAALQMTN